MKKCGNARVHVCACMNELRECEARECGCQIDAPPALTCPLCGRNMRHGLGKSWFCKWAGCTWTQSDDRQRLRRPEKAPDGYEFTGECRLPKKGEAYDCGGRSQAAGEDHKECSSWPLWILRPAKPAPVATHSPLRIGDIIRPCTDTARARFRDKLQATITAAKTNGYHVACLGTIDADWFRANCEFRRDGTDGSKPEHWERR